ncbi:O-antigen polysaccharide polymerase Wzy, partial [Vibrio anguillarum]|nr:O-antigen polysaccharide polymerase Wzy [Vibrio anguillarum]MBF4253633.1 O-antigen polysaccharide polymerase Wzy [Vibrio anguillarum]
RRKVVYLYLAATIVPILHQVFRSEFLSLTKTWWWYMILPILGSLIASKLRFKL